MARVVVEVMPKPEILDPQGKAVTGALERIGFTGLQVRQGKRFEIEVGGTLDDDAAVERVRKAAEMLLCNTVIENFEVHLEDGAVAEKAHDTDNPTVAPRATTPQQGAKNAAAPEAAVPQGDVKKAAQ